MPNEKYEYRISGCGPDSFRRACEDGYVPTQERITLHEDITPAPAHGPPYRQVFYQLKNGKLREVTPQNVPFGRGRNIESIIKGETRWKLVKSG